MQKSMLWSVMRYLSATEKLFIAAERGCAFSVNNLITKHAANPYSKDCNGMTPLHIAARDGHFKVCEFLVEEIKTNAKNTASKCEQIDNQQIEPFIKVQRLEYIVENRNKCLFNETDNNGNTALFLATATGTEFPELLTQKHRNELEAKYNPIITLLTQAGALVTPKDLNNCKVRYNTTGLEILEKARKPRDCRTCPTAASCNKHKL